MDDILAKKNRHLFLEEKDNTHNSFISNINYAVENIDTIKTFNDNVNSGTMQHLLETYLEQVGAEGNAWVLRLTELGESILATTSGFNYAAVLTVTQDIEAGATITLPEAMKYRVGTHMLLVSWNGTVCYRGEQYEEIGAFNERSSTIKIKQPIKIGDKLEFRTVALTDAATVEAAISSCAFKINDNTVKRTIVERFSDIVNVKDYGAVGDGETDDTQAFLNAGATNSNVFVPKGTYVVNSSIPGSFFSVDDIVIEGSGSVVIKSWKTLVELYEVTTGGRRTIRFNKDGVPSVFYRFPMYYLDDIVSTWPHKPHPAFVINNPTNGNEIILREILIGCYEASLYNGKYLVSQPNRQPFSYQPFDIQVAYCRANNIEGGISVDYSRSDPNNYTITKNNPDALLDINSHFHMITNAEYSAVALWLQKKGYEPRGNSWFGCNGFHTEEKGTFPNRRYNYNTQQWEDYNGIPGDGNKNSPTYGNCPTLTGSSPLAWMHDGSAFGIENFVGNMATVVAGTRCYNGQLQSFVNNNAALPDADFCGRTPLSPDGSLDDGETWTRQTYYQESWKGYKAFDVSGNYIHPETASLTLKLDGSYTSDGHLTPYTDTGNTEASDDDVYYSRGCGATFYNTVIASPDSGGSDLTPMSYDEDTGEYVLDPENGESNGSARVWFANLCIAPDDPAEAVPVRETDVQPSYLMRCLGLYPVCSKSDLYNSTAIAQSTNRYETNAATGIYSYIEHSGYYYNNGYLSDVNTVQRDEIKNWYNTQNGRVWTRARGDICHVRGGTYYYEDPAKSTSDARQVTALWTQSFSGQRYDRLIAEHVPVTGSGSQSLNYYSDLGVGWMTGTRLCVIEY